MTVKELPFGTQIEGKKNGVFVAITTESQIYKNYHDPNMTEEYKNAYYPLVLMVERWDGKTGFIGGFQEPNMSLYETVVKETVEEAGIKEGFVEPQFVPVCAHELEWIVVHMYHINLGKQPLDILRAFLSEGSMAEHCISEGCLKWVHLADYGKNKGINTLLGSNVLASAVKEELEVILKRLSEKK